MIEMVHHLSFDVEDVYQSFKERGISGWIKDVDGEKDRILEILNLLDEYGHKATFFILTEIIPDYKDIILEIEVRGHEIASHGHEHLRIKRRSREDFGRDIRESKFLLENLINQEVLGYRAPGFSLNESTSWAVEEIKNAGFKYSSSASSVKQYSKLSEALSEYSLLEFPATSINIFGKDLRLCGGFYFRALPLSLTKTLFKRFERKGQAINLYLHPYEFEINPNKLKSRVEVSFIRYYNLNKTYNNLEKLLKTRIFTSFENNVR
jgi:polysaccharide deacetylase family protein (PEP-CTERM system associated)